MNGFPALRQPPNPLPEPLISRPDSAKLPTLYSINLKTMGTQSPLRQNPLGISGYLPFVAATIVFACPLMAQDQPTQPSTPAGEVPKTAPPPPPAAQPEKKKEDDDNQKLDGSRAGEVRSFGGIEFVWCPPTGEFGYAMGSKKTEKSRESDERLHRVMHTRGFWIARTECTQAQFASLMGGNPSHFRSSGDHPVEMVDWAGAMEFCRLLDRNAQLPEGWKASLPTEAQWEYACRAGTDTVFSFGDALNGKQANCNGSYRPYGATIEGPNVESTVPVKSYEANKWGIYDMHGNVWEWCFDKYGKTYYGEEQINPTGPSVGSYRVCRGGSWRSEAKYCRAANRFRGNPTLQRYFIGFRPVITPTDYSIIPVINIPPAEMPKPAGDGTAPTENKLFPGDKKKEKNTPAEAATPKPAPSNTPPAPASAE